MGVLKTLEKIKLWIILFCKFITLAYGLQFESSQKKYYKPWKYFSNDVFHIGIGNDLTFLSNVVIFGSRTINLTPNHFWV